MGGGSLVPYLVVLLAAVSHRCQYVYSRWISFGMGALIIKNLISGSYSVINLKDKDSIHCHRQTG